GPAAGMVSPSREGTDGRADAAYLLGPSVPRPPGPLVVRLGLRVRPPGRDVMQRAPGMIDRRIQPSHRIEPAQSYIRVQPARRRGTQIVLALCPALRGHALRQIAA